MSGSSSAKTILSDAHVILEMRRAFEESHVGGDDPIEQGGFILRSPTGGELEVARLPPDKRDSLAFPLCPDGTYLGKHIVGSFHTHPNAGPEWQQEPSLQDIRLSQDYPETMGPHHFVLSREIIYHIDSDGNVSELGLTQELLQLPVEE